MNGTRRGGARKPGPWWGLALAASAAACSSPSNLYFSSSPADGTAGSPLRPVVVHLVDSRSKAVEGASAEVTLTLAGPAGATLSGTTTVATVKGVATFTDLVVDKVGIGYSVIASAKGYEDARSSTFAIVAGEAVKLGFVAQPGDAAAGDMLSPLVQVELQDLAGNRVMSSGISIGISLAENPGGAALGGRTTVLTTSGMASFPDLTVNRPGSGYVLKASAPDLADAVTGPFNVRLGPPSKLSFAVQPPPSTTAGAAMAPAVEVTVADLGGNRVDASVPISLTLRDNPGGGALSGTTSATSVNGVATFSDLSIDKTGAGYRLLAVSGPLIPGASAPFEVVPGPASQLGFSVQPEIDHVGRPVAPVVEVSIQDALGNVVPGASGTITVALGANPGGATLTGTLSRATTAGTAAFGDLSLDRVGAGYTLVATGGAYAAVTSQPFDVVDPAFVYTESSSPAKVRLVRSPTSTARTIVLDLVADQPLTGYSVGLNLPVDPERVALGATPLVPGAALDPGVAPMAAKAVLPASGLLQGVVVSGLTQKAAGAGAVPADATIPAGATLYTLRLDMKDSALLGVVFDGAALGPKFRATLRDRQGTEVAGQSEFGIGKLEVR